MSSTKLVAVFIVCVSIFATNMQLMQQRVSPQYFSRCIVEAISYFFASDTDIMYFEAHHMEETFSFTGDILKLLEDRITRGLVVRSFTNGSNDLTRYNHKYNYIIETKNKNELIETIDMLSNFPTWDSHAEFLVITSKHFEKPYSTAATFSEILWRKKVVRVAVILPSARKRSVYEVYSWNPFQKSNIGNTLPKDSCLSGKFQRKVPLFGEAFGKCSNDCIFKAHYIDWPPLILNANFGFKSSNYLLSQGFDINLLNMVASKLNLTVLYYTTGTLWGKIHENGTVQGNLALLLNDSADILVGGYRKTADRINYFDVTHSHIQLFEVWCVSDTPVMVGFRSMSNIFRVEVWILAIMVYLLVCVCIYISSNREIYEFTAYRNVDNTLLTSLAVFLGIGANVLPRGRSARYFMTLLIVFGFYVTLFYSGYLTSIISAPKYVQKFSTLKDIYDYGLKTYFMQDDIKWILNDSSITSVISAEMITQRWKTCHNMTWCFERVANMRATSFYTDNLHKDYFLASTSCSMHCIQHNKIGTPIAIILRKGFPFYKQFDTIISHIIEAGFVWKWANDIFKFKTWSHSNDSSDNASIKFENLLPIFNFLLVGNFVAFVAFLVEIAIKRYYR